MKTKDILLSAVFILITGFSVYLHRQPMPESTALAYMKAIGQNSYSVLFAILIYLSARQHNAHMGQRFQKGLAVMMGFLAIGQMILESPLLAR